MNVSWMEIPVTIQDELVRKEAPSPLELQSSRSFPQALATATSRTLSKEGRFSILSTMYRRVDMNDMSEIGLCQMLCR
jgi:hypothetical protein